MPQIKDPHDIITFLNQQFQFNLTTSGSKWGCEVIQKYKYKAIQNALHILANTFECAAIEALEDFNPVEPLFVCGICDALQDTKPLQLCRAAFFSLPLISDKWFNSSHPIMDLLQMKNFYTGWTSVVDAVEHTHDVQVAALTVFLGMINSDCWHPHIVVEQWKLLEYLTLVPDDLQPLRRCINNPELMDVIRSVENPATAVFWLTTLWLKYGELVPQVQKQLETVTEELAQGERKADLNKCLETMDSELGRVEGVLVQLEKTNDKMTEHDTKLATALRTEIKRLKKAKIPLLFSVLNFGQSQQQ